MRRIRLNEMIKQFEIIIKFERLLMSPPSYRASETATFLSGIICGLTREKNGIQMRECADKRLIKIDSTRKFVVLSGSFIREYIFIIHVSTCLITQQSGLVDAVVSSLSDWENKETWETSSYLDSSWKQFLIYCTIQFQKLRRDDA